MVNNQFNLLKSLLIAGSLVTSLNVYAEDKKASPSAEEAAKELANPNTALASLNFKPTYTSYDDFETESILFQPILPFPRKDGSKIIIRPAVTYMIDNGFDESGMLDISSDVFYAYAMDKWDSGAAKLEGLGVIFSLPSGDEKLGQGEVTSLGASYIVGSLSAEEVSIFFPSHLQSVDEGDFGDAGKVSLTTIQVGRIWLPGGGWNFGTMPKIKYNWEADSGEEWTVPLNLSVGKTLVLAGRPWKFSAEVDYFVEAPDNGPEFALTFTITPVVENTLASWF